MPQYKKVFDVGTYAGGSGYTRVGIPTLRTPGSGGKQVPRSLRFRAANTAYLSRTSGTSTDQTKATLSFWMKAAPSSSSTTQTAIWCSSANNAMVAWNTVSYSGKLFVRVDGVNDILYTNLFKDPSVWQHIVISVDTTQATAVNRVKTYVNGILLTPASGTAALNSTAFNASSTVFNIGKDIGNSWYWDGYLSDYYFIDGQQYDATYFGEYNSDNIWVPKAYSGSYTGNSFYLPMSDNSALSPFGGTALGTNTYTAGGFGSSTVVNTVQSIPNNTVITYAGQYSNSAESNKYIYVVRDNGGGSFTLMATSTIFNHPGNGLYLTPLNYTVPSTGTYYLASLQTAGGLTWGHDGTGTQYYITVPISGTQTYTALGGYGSPSLVWLTSTPTGLTKDFSGLGNHWQPAGISITSGTTYDSMYDSPTDYDNSVYGAGNYCTLNPLTKDPTNGTISNANLTIAYTAFSVNNAAGVRGTIGVNTGKWYFEHINVIGAGSGNISAVGVTSYTGTLYGYSAQSGTIPTYVGALPSVYSNNVTFATYGVSASLANGTTLFASYASGDVISIAIDFDAGKIWIGKNGTWYNSGNPAAGTNPTSTFTTPSTICFPEIEAVTSSTNGNQSIAHINFGQQPWDSRTSGIPSGFKALHTKNITRPTDANMWFYGDTPDLMWIKNRSATSDHSLTDTVRGVGLGLSSNQATAEQGAQDVAEMNKFGMTLIGASSRTTAASNNFVYFALKGGGTATSNGSGTITSSVSANANAGFSVIAYTGNGSVSATVGHGLGIAPAMVITKSRDTSTYQWTCWHTYYGTSTSNKLLFSRNDATVASDANGYVTSLNSSTFGFGGGTAAVNTNNEKYIAYCFAPVAGYSAFGSYTGNGSADGPFVYTGFRPRFVLVKNTSVAGDWYIFDTTRSSSSGLNVEDYKLYPNTSNAENGLAGETTSTNNMDTLSNGFKLRTTNGNTNGSTNVFIYAAFAEAPFKTARAR